MSKSQDSVKRDFEEWACKTWPHDKFDFESYTEDAYGTLQYHSDFTQGMWMAYINLNEKND